MLMFCLFRAKGIVYGLLNTVSGAYNSVKWYWECFGFFLEIPALI